MEYEIPDGLSLEAVEAEIREHLGILAEPAGDVDATYYDTFDWALHADGGLLYRRGGSLRWIALDGGASCVQPIEGEPGLAGSLPPGPVHERMPAGSELRRLLVMMRVRTRERTLRVLDENAKTVVRLVLTDNSFEDPWTGRSGALRGRLRIEGIRGYDDDRDILVALLEGKLGLKGAEQPPLLEALSIVGRSPADYSSKLDLPLDPEERADSVTKRILLSLLDVMEANVQGAREGWDTEFLHDLRVATRRTRSALSQIKSVFPDEIVTRFKEGFAWVQQATGPVRDLDVYLLAFEEYRAALPGPLRPKLEPLRAFLIAHYDEEQGTLAKALGSTRFRELLQSWREFLQTPVPSRSVVPNAMRPIRSVANERIRRMAKRVRDEGRAIRPDSMPDELHELRKSCKKLRYLIEFFRSLYPPAEIKGVIKQLKGLLDQLGTYQDLAVQARHLEDIAARMASEGKAPPDTLLAVGALVGGLLTRQERARARFTEVFAAFDDPSQWEQYRALFWRK